MKLHRLNREGEHSWWIWKGDGAHTVAKGWWKLGDSPIRSFEIEFALGGEDSMAQVMFRVPFVFAAAVGVRVPRKWLAGWVYHRREVSLTAPYVAGIWALLRVGWDQGLDGMEDYYRGARERGEDLIWSEAATRQGWEIRLRPRLLDRIFGRVVYSKQESDPEPIVIAMPEGRYPATATRRRQTWKRPRSPRARSGYSWTVSVEGGLPVPGKGENSWDCGDDAIYSSSFPDDGISAAEAGRRMADSAMKTRSRYASLAWAPRDGWPETVIR